MGTIDSIIPDNGIISTAMGNLGKYSWVLWIILGVIILFFIVFFIVQMKLAKKQWTHKLLVKRILNNSDELSEPELIRMKRFPDKKLTDFFILEKPLMGTYVMNNVGEYSAPNTFSVILDRNNRIFREKKARLNRETGIINVSAVHPNIDTRWHMMLEAFEQMYAIKPGVDWAKIGKWALTVIIVIGSIIVGIVALQEHTEQVKIEAERDKAIAGAMTDFAGAMDAMESSVLTQAVLFEAMKDLYGEAGMKDMIAKFNSEAYFSNIKYANVTK